MDYQTMFEFKKIKKEDLLFLNEVRNECAPKYLHDSRTFSYEEVVNWFEKTNPNYYLVFYQNIRIGYFRLSNYSSVNKTIYIGMDLHKDWRGKKLAYDAYKQFIPHIVKELNLRKIYLEVLSTNIVAKNLYKKLGFELESIKKHDVIKNGILVDSEIMSLYVNKTCLIVNFYFGDRRNPCKKYEEDRLILLKTQIDMLTKINHNLSKIVFYFNIDETDFGLMNTVIKMVPNSIQNSSLDIRFRNNKNGGYSYGSFSDAFTEYKEKFDYFIFLEDDYFIIENYFDSILIDIYHSYKNCGYLCSLKTGTFSEGEHIDTHAANSFGIASKNNLQLVFDKFGRLPYKDGNSYSINEHSQILFSNAFIQVGLEIYDLRNYYKLLHSSNTAKDCDFFQYFSWNNNSIILPDKIIIDKIEDFITFTFVDKQYHYKY